MFTIKTLHVRVHGMYNTAELNNIGTLSPSGHVQVSEFLRQTNHAHFFYYHMSCYLTIKDGISELLSAVLFITWN